MKLSDLKRQIDRLVNSQNVSESIEVTDQELNPIIDVYLAFDGIKYLSVVLSSISSKPGIKPKKKK